jgi:hypothetical protein
MQAGLSYVPSLNRPTTCLGGWALATCFFSTLSLNNPYDGPNAPGCSASIILHLARVIRSSQVVYDLSSGLISNPPFVIRHHGLRAKSPKMFAKTSSLPSPVNSNLKRETNAKKERKKQPPGFQRARSKREEKGQYLTRPSGACRAF